MLTHLGVHLGHVSSVLRGIRGNLGTSKLLKAQGHLWFSETPNTHSATWCSGAGDCITLLPHWQDSSKPYQGGKGTGCWTRSLLLPWMVLDLQEHIQIQFCLCLDEEKSSLGRQHQPCCPSSPSIPKSYMSQTGFVLVSLFLCLLGSFPLPRAGETVPLLGGHQSCFPRAEFTDSCRQGRLWCPGDANPALCCPAPLCHLGEPKYKPERLNSYFELLNQREVQ